MDYNGRLSAVSSSDEALATTLKQATRHTQPIPYVASESGGWGLGIEPKPSELDLQFGSAHCDVNVSDLCYP